LRLEAGGTRKKGWRREGERLEARGERLEAGGEKARGWN
jgi:hypothetical protein